MIDARTPPARRFPVVTVIAMAAAVVAPAVMVMVLVTVIDGGQGSVVILLIAPVLGVVGAVAAFFSRNLEVGLRWVWALLSVALGFAVPTLLWTLIVLLFGP